MTYGASLHKGTGAAAIRVNKMNISPMSIRFTRPTHGHLSPKQIRAEIYDLLLVAPSVLQHDATYVGKLKRRKKNTGKKNDLVMQKIYRLADLILQLQKNK